MPNSKIKDILKAFLLLKTLVKAGDKICMPKDEFIAEHVKLLNTLKHPTKEKLSDEAEEQSSELNEELEKGQNGDWQKEGYKISHTITPHQFFDDEKNLHIYAHDKDNNQVAHAIFQYGNNGKALMSEGSTVHPLHRRIGLANAMYQHAENISNAKIIPSDTRTDDARALWDQPNRPFGKKEMTEAGDIKKPKWQDEGYTVQHEPASKHYPSNPSKEGFQIVARNKEGHRVGAYHFEHNDDTTISPHASNTDMAHRRKGLASAAYTLAEKLANKSLTPEGPDSRTRAAQALWSQPNRPFGKSEPLTKAPSEAARVNIQPRHLDQYADQDIKNNAHIETRSLGTPQDKSINIYGRTINSPANGQELFHHIILAQDGNTTHHKLSTSDNPQDPSLVNLMVEHYHNFPDWKGIPTAKLSIAREPGFGLGSKLYEEALKHHGKLQSDHMVTDAAHKLWSKLLKHPDVRGHLGALGAGEDRHYAEWHGLNKSESLQKMGAARRLYGNFDPIKELDGNKKMSSWTTGNYGDDSYSKRSFRGEIPEPSPNAKLRMINKLSRRAVSRLNPETKQREFLLHRQMSGSEARNTINNGIINHAGIQHSSWTPHLSTITESDGIYNRSTFRPEDNNSYNTIVSAWIPESHIKTMPIQYGEAGTYDANKKGSPTSTALKEQEVIVRPGHNSQIHEIHKDTGLSNSKWDWVKTLGKSEELAKAVRMRPTQEGQLDESTGDIAKIHSNGNLMWHAGPDKARSHDATLRNQDLINNYTQSFRHETHRKVFPKIVQNVLNDPNRHFIPTEENGSHRIRARHIKNLLLGDPNYKMDLSDPNKILITALKRHGSDESPTTWTYNIVQKGAGNEKLKRSEGSNQRRSSRDFEVILESVRCGGDDRGYTGDLEEGGSRQISTRRDTGYRDGLEKSYMKRHLEEDLVKDETFVKARSEKPVNPKDPVLGPKRVIKPPRKDWEARIKAYIERQVKKSSNTEMWSGLLGHLKKSDDSWQQSYLHHKEQEIPTILHHYSRQSGLSTIDPKKMGTGTSGSFNRNFDPSKIPDFPHTSFYYRDPNQAEDVVKTGAKSKYTVKMQPHHKLYDLTEDKAGLVKQARAENNGAWNYEAVLDKIKNAGYHGTWAPKSDDPVIANTVQLFHPQVPTSEERFE